MARSRISHAAMVVLLIGLSTSSARSAEPGTDEAAIERTLADYAAALNASSTERVLPLYADDGVFMQPYGPSSVGKAAIRAAYDADFSAFSLKVTFRPVEVVVVAPTWAFARTQSAGTQTVHATGAQSAEANQELFLFHKQDGTWKIARYAFSTTNAPTVRP